MSAIEKYLCRKSQKSPPSYSQISSRKYCCPTGHTLGVQNFEQKSRPKSTKQTYESGSRKHHQLLTST